MEKAKAIAHVKDMYEHMVFREDKEALETLIPELKESEDERVIKGLENFLWCIANGGMNDRGTMPSAEMCQKWLAYLEKQKDHFRDDTKMVEQKHIAWSEDYREEDIQTRFAFYTYKDDPSVLYLSNVFVEETSRNHGFGTRILKAAEKAAEAIGAITICLKVKQDSPANAWYRKRGYGYVAFEDGYDWLEKNLEYLKPTKQEWSEEDEKKINFLSRLIEFQVKDDEYCFGDGRLISKQEAIEMLKSLRPSWKPSEEQMEALHYVKQFDYGGHKAALVSLYEQLKQL